ncbi:MAG: hypothetical protein ACXVCP_16750 [Bdellovibrio sp.]
MSVFLLRYCRLIISVWMAFGFTVSSDAFASEGNDSVASDSEIESNLIKPKATQVQSEDRYLVIKGQLFRYHIDYFSNQYGEREMQVSLVEAHWLVRDSKLLVLYGRDTDSDNRIDAWFYSDGEIIKSLRKASNSSDGWPVAKELLQKFSLNESRWISTLITKEILAGLFFTAEGEFQDIKELEQMQIDLFDLEYKISDLEKSKENPALTEELKKVSSQGWSRFLGRWNSTRMQDRRNRMVGDVAMFVGGGLALKGVKFLAVKGLSSEAMSSVKSYLNKIAQQQDSWINQVSARVSSFSGKSATEEATSSLKFASQSEALAWLSSKTYFSKSLKKVGTLIKDVAAESWHAKGYILASQSIQVAVESYNAGYWRASEPLTLTHPIESTPDFIKTLVTNDSLMHNVEYMTLQTTLLSGMDEYLERRGHGLKMKMPVCSIITFVDSMSMNVLFAANPNVRRVGFDTGWELVIGTNQVLLDKAMIRKAAEYANKVKKPGLRVVGFFLAAADQLVGYAGYNKVTNALFPSSQANTQASTVQTAQANQAIPPVIVIPVLAPK